MTKRELQDLQESIEALRQSIRGIDDRETCRIDVGFVRLAIARIDELQARLNILHHRLAAVPVDAIRYRLANSEQSPECWGDWDNRCEAYTKASDEIDAWLKTQVTP
jgi:hypothetical protein